MNNFDRLSFFVHHQDRIPKKYRLEWQIKEDELRYNCEIERINNVIFAKPAAFKYDFIQSELEIFQDDISEKWKQKYFLHLQNEKLKWGKSLNIISGTNYMCEVLIELFKKDLICSSFLKKFDELISNPDQIIYLDNLEFVESKLFLVLKKFADIGVIKITDYAGVNKKNKAIYNYIESHFRFSNYDEKRNKHVARRLMQSSISRTKILPKIGEKKISQYDRFSAQIDNIFSLIEKQTINT